MTNTTMKNYSKQAVILILSVFIVFSISFRIGAFRTNSPIEVGEELLVYSSIVNHGTGSLKDVRVGYTLFNTEETFYDVVDSRDIDVKSDREEGRASLYETENLDGGEYWLKMTVNNDGDKRSRYLPVDVIG